MTARIEILSQQLPLLGNDAAAGNEQAFVDLKKRCDLMIGMLTQLEQNEGMAGFADLDFASRKVGADVAKILEGRDAVLASRALVEEISQKLPPLDARLDELSMTLSERQGSSKQVLLLTREMLVAGRIQRRLQAIEHGGEDAVAAADGVRRDAKYYGVVLAGLLDGNADLGLKKLNDANARQLLQDISAQWNEIAPKVTKLADAAPALQAVREAEENLRADSDTLWLKADPVFVRYNN